MALNLQSLSVSVPMTMANRPLPSLPDEISLKDFTNSKKQVTFEPTVTSLSATTSCKDNRKQKNRQFETERERVQKKRKVLRLQIRRTRHRFCCWDNHLIIRIILSQIIAVAIIFICQCIMWVKFGDPIFSILVGLIGFLMPMVYILGLLQSLYTHVLPTYCKISFACVIQGLASYSAIFVITRDVAYLVHFNSYSLNVLEPRILWLIIFMTTCYISVTSLILLLVSMHDICYFRRVGITIAHPVRPYVVRNISQLINQHNPNFQNQNQKSYQIQIDQDRVKCNHYCRSQSAPTTRDGDVYVGSNLETSNKNFYEDFNYI